MARHLRPAGARRGLAGVLLLALAALLVVGAVQLSSNGAAQPTAIAPLPTVPPAPPTPTTAHEDHVHVAASTPAGTTAFQASERVNRDRQAAVGNPATRLTQQQLNDVGPLMFGPNTAQLTNASEDKLARVADMLRATPSTRVEVVGHTAVEITNPDLCLQLSQLRAEMVLGRLHAAGIAPSRVEVVGVSHAQPLSNARDSRRAELIVLSQ